ncbi:hypothetical protein SVIOM74S_06637 [Streptomyces violarus]
MHPFTYTKATDTREALNAGRRGGRYIAGGTTLVDLMRETVEHPGTLVDISALPLREVTVTMSGGLRVGALVRMAEAAAHPKVRALYPVISQALELSASAQLRNMASIGGNIMQRTRCTYFRDVTADCNKREPGTGCAALHGYNRSHAILGTSDSCVATHPSDLAVALAALEATVHLLGPDGERTVPFADFLLQPGNTPNREQDLKPGELITAVQIPAHPRPLKSGYLKVRDRQSYRVRAHLGRGSRCTSAAASSARRRSPSAGSAPCPGSSLPSSKPSSANAPPTGCGPRPWGTRPTGPAPSRTTASRPSCSNAPSNAS